MAGVMPCSTQVGQHQGSVVGTSLRGGCRQSVCQPASGATLAHQHGLYVSAEPQAWQAWLAGMSRREGLMVRWMLGRWQGRSWWQ
jgi:hypothetical protein